MNAQPNEAGRKPARILIVDDSPTNRLHLELLAGRLGHATAAVADGKAALEQAMLSPPDLIVLDLSLDAPGPAEILDGLRAEPATANLPIIALTNPDDLDTLVEVLHDRRTQALTRPFDAISLGRCIDAALALPGVSHSVGSSTEPTVVLLAHLGHDLRTPLNAVQGYSQLVRDELMDMGQGDLADDLVKVMDGGRRMLAMIDDLTDLARAELGSLRFERREVAFRALLEADIERLNRQAIARGAELTARWDDGGGRFIGDPGRLRQVVLGLLDSAASAGSSGQIRFSADHLGGTAWELAVEAPGFGVSPEDLTRILTAPDWAGCGAVQAEGGRVLSLILARKLAEGQGGTLAVEPLEAGATRVTLRVESAAESEAPAHVPIPPIEPLEPPSTAAPISILLAEDSPVNRGLIRLFLERLGQSVDMAGDGTEVMEALARADYDVVLMDVQMPGLDGLETSRRVRSELPLDRQPRIIGLTALAPPEGRKECLEAGMDDYLAKPVQPADLAAALARHAPRNASPAPA